MDNLIQLGNWILSSGKKADFKLVADRFIEENLEGLVYLVRKKMMIPYSTVEGIPTGGTRLATALLRKSASYVDPHLIVDDVLTTGRSMERAKSQYIQTPVVGLVVFARGPCPSWIKAVFTLPKELWLNEEELA